MHCGHCGEATHDLPLNGSLGGAGVAVFAAHISTEASHGRICDGQRRCCSHSCIGCISTRLEDTETGFSRERLCAGHHPPRACANTR